MKRTSWLLALSLPLAWAGGLRAQPPPYLAYGGSGFYSGYGGFPFFGPGIGFAYRGRRLAISGFLGGLTGASYGYQQTYVFGPPPAYGAYPPPLVNIVIQPSGEAGPFRRRPTLQEETAGIDLDAALPKKESPPDEPPPQLPGPDVSKPVPPVRPEDVPAPKPAQPKAEAPKPPPVPPPPELPPPRDDPKEESARLTNLGLAAFSAQSYGLAARRFQQATLADPKGARAYFLLAQARFALGKYAEAVEAVHAGMGLHKNWPQAPFQPRVDLYAGIEPDFAEHLKRLEAAVKQAQQQPELLFLLAYQLWFDSRRNEAVALFRQARPLAPNPAFIHQFLAAAAPKQVVAN